MGGYVYVMVNEAIPGLVKVGMTTRSPQERAIELRNAGNPGTFVVAYCVEVADPQPIEHAAHQLLQAVHHGKEWFQCTVGRAAMAIQEAAGPDAREVPVAANYIRRSPGPMHLLSQRQREMWEAYFEREREILDAIAKATDPAERRAWENELLQADRERSAGLLAKKSAR